MRHPPGSTSDEINTECGGRVDLVLDYCKLFVYYFANQTCYWSASTMIRGSELAEALPNVIDLHVPFTPISGRPEQCQ